MTVKIFFCYAHEDEELLNKLRTHLTPLQREGHIDVWHDRDISAGTEWEPEIRNHLDAAQIILLLVSPDFIKSDYCYGVEMQRAIKRHEQREAQVIPVILDHVDWQIEPLKKLQALPTDAKPILSAGWHSQNEAFFDVAKGIRKVVEGLISEDQVKRFTQPTETKILADAKSSAGASTKTLPPPHATPSVRPAKPEKFTFLRTLTKDLDYILSVTISPGGQTLASGNLDGTIKVWNLHTWKPLHTFEGHSTVVSSVAISPDGKTLFSGSNDKTIKVWDLDTGKLLRTLEGHSQPVTSIAFSPDPIGQILASGSYDMTIKLWNPHTGTPICTLEGHSEKVTSIAFSPDGKTLASGSHDTTIKVWNPHTETLICTLEGLEGHSQPVTSIAFSPDGRTLASGSYDTTIKVWYIHLQKLLYTLEGHSDGVRSVAFSPDGQTIASGSHDKTIKVWDLDTGKLLRTLKGHSREVTSIAFSPDGKILASGSHDTMIKIWGKK